jgi:hypothetical protein
MAIAISVLALAAVAAGCGGGDDSSGSSSDSSSATTLTKAEFIKEADAICGDANEQGETEAEEFAEENDFTLEKASEEQLEDAVAAVFVPSLNQQAEEIAALGAPEGEEEQVEALTSSLEDAASEIEDDPGVALGGDALNKPAKLAQELGLKVCGS